MSIPTMNQILADAITLRGLFKALDNMGNFTDQESIAAIIAAGQPIAQRVAEDLDAYSTAVEAERRFLNDTSQIRKSEKS